MVQNVHSLCCSQKLFPLCRSRTAQSMAHYSSLWSWLQVSAFIWCPELTSKDVAAWRVAWERGCYFFSVQLRAETLRIWCKEIYKPAWEGSLFTEEKHGFCQPSQPALSPSKTNICDSFGSMQVACRLLNGQCKMSGGC